MPLYTQPDKPSATGVTGLDEILKGGLPEHRLYLILGEPGVGKTTLALQYLLEGAKRGEPGMYIALSETREEIHSVARSHHWAIDKLSIFELSALEQQLAQDEVAEKEQPELNRVTELLLERIQQVRPKRLVIDSLSELRLLSESPLRYRRQLLSFKQFFAGQQVTVVLLDDHSDVANDLHVQSIAHGVIRIEKSATAYGAEKRRLKIDKLRGLNFVGGFHDAIIEPGGMRIFPRLVGSEHKRRSRRGLMKSGLEALDLLVGGGLDRGTSCLLLGPAGTGKSSLAIQFAVAAARRKEKVFLCLFEENIDTMLARSASIGLPLEEYITAGLITVKEVDPAELAPGEFIHCVIDHVREKDSSIVLIDSLNGYMQAMPDINYLQIQLHELLSFLNRHGVLSLLTVAQHGLIGHMQTPIDLTYLADTIILLRYFEQGGRIKKAVSVVKKRIGKHEDTIREFRIDAEGLRVGAPLANFQGVLTGNPIFTGKADQMLENR